MQRMRIQQVLRDHPSAPDVERRPDHASLVAFHRDGGRVRAAGIGEVGQRQDAVVAPRAPGRAASPATRRGVIQRQDPGEVALLVPQLGRFERLAREVRGHAVGRDRRSRRPPSKCCSAMCRARMRAL